MSWPFTTIWAEKDFQVVYAEPADGEEHVSLIDGWELPGSDLVRLRTIVVQVSGDAACTDITYGGTYNVSGLNWINQTTGSKDKYKPGYARNVAVSALKYLCVSPNNWITTALDYEVHIGAFVRKAPGSFFVVLSPTAVVDGKSLNYLDHGTLASGASNGTVLEFWVEPPPVAVRSYGGLLKTDRLAAKAIKDAEKAAAAAAEAARTAAWQADRNAEVAAYEQSLIDQAAIDKLRNEQSIVFNDGDNIV